MKDFLERVRLISIVLIDFDWKFLPTIVNFLSFNAKTAMTQITHRALQNFINWFLLPFLLVSLVPENLSALDF